MNIALVATGGTIGSRLDANGDIVLSDAATEQISSIIGASAVYDKLKIHSERMHLPDLNGIREAVKSAISKKPDAVIVTHGTDTLSFSAAYLAYAFCSTNIPIVLCAADLPLTERESNGFAVLNSAKMFVQSRKPGVYVICKNPGFSPKIHHGARLLSAHFFDSAFGSIAGGAFGDTGLFNGMDFDVSGVKVLMIDPYVGMEYSGYKLDGYSAIVHTPFNSGTVNVDDFNAFASATDKPIFLTTGFARYKTAFPDNVVCCPAITPAALYIKLLIGIKNKVKDLTAFVLKNGCGEIATN